MSEHPELPVDRLGKSLRMLASSHNGEVAATVEALKRTLANAGTDIHALADKIEHERFTEEEARQIYRKGGEAKARQAQQAQQPRSEFFRNVGEPQDELGDWRDQAEAILDSGRANAWETNFCGGLLRSWRGPELTQKQNEVLERIFKQQIGRWPT